MVGRVISLSLLIQNLQQSILAELILALRSKSIRMNFPSRELLSLCTVFALENASKATPALSIAASSPLFPVPPPVAA